LAEGFVRIRWDRQLSRWARQVNPLLQGRGPFAKFRYYWVAEQAD